MTLPLALHDPDPGARLVIVPLNLDVANNFVYEFHRHNDPVQGQKFAVGCTLGEKLVGVAITGRPISRELQNNTLCAEIRRNCTDGTRNACSKLYGASARACKAMGYRRVITYTQADESGASLRAAGFVRVKELPPRKSWAESSVKDKHLRDPNSATGGVARVLWEIRFQVAR